jgi:hypothetical protein
MRAAHGAHHVSAAVLLVIGVQNKQNVERACEYWIGHVDPDAVTRERKCRAISRRGTSSSCSAPNSWIVGDPEVVQMVARADRYREVLGLYLERPFHDR